MDREKCKTIFFDEVKRLLFDYPEQFKVFNDIWTTGDYKLAYSMLIRVCNENNIDRNDEEFNKIDNDFYWLFIA
jgi:hypothetical protein